MVSGVAKRYDWTACLMAVVAGLGMAAAVGIAANRLFDSGLLLMAVVTVVGTTVGRLVYARLAKSGSRPLDPD